MEKLWNMKVTVISVVIGAQGTVTKGLVVELELFEIIGNHPNYCISEFGQNTKKCSGNLRRLAVTKTPVRNHQLTLV